MRVLVVHSTMEHSGNGQEAPVSDMSEKERAVSAPESGAPEKGDESSKTLPLC